MEGVGVMKDEEIKFEEIEDLSHTRWRGGMIHYCHTHINIGLLVDSEIVLSTRHSISILLH